MVRLWVISLSNFMTDFFYSLLFSEIDKTSETWGVKIEPIVKREILETTLLSHQNKIFSNVPEIDPDLLMRGRGNI